MAENLGAPVNTDAWDGLPYIARDESFLIFYSDREGGYGNGDLYVSFRTQSQWTTPVNLGPSVNTHDDELFPYVDVAGGRLFFSRWDDDGRRDIYSVDLRDTPLGR